MLPAIRIAKEWRCFKLKHVVGESNGVSTEVGIPTKEGEDVVVEVTASSGQMPQKRQTVQRAAKPVPLCLNVPVRTKTKNNNGKAYHTAGQYTARFYCGFGNGPCASGSLFFHLPWRVCDHHGKQRFGKIYFTEYLGVSWYLQLASYFSMLPVRRWEEWEGAIA